MPQAFEDYVIGHVAGLVGQQVENNIWNGTTATSGQFTGFCTDTVGTFVTDGDVVDVDLGAGSAYDKDTIVTHLESVIDALPTQVVSHPDFAIYLNPKSLFYYMQKLGAQGYANDYQANEKPANIYGYPIYACPGIPDEVIVGTHSSNLNFGSNILTNLTEVNVIDRSPIDGSDNVRFVMRYSAGVQHGVGGDIAFGKTTS